MARTKLIKEPKVRADYTRFEGGETQQDNGGQTAGTTAQWTPMQEKEQIEQPSYSDLVAEAKTNNQATFDTLREQSASDLINANVQTELAKVAANKGLATRMNAMGLGNSGYAGTQAGNIQSAYMQGLNRNQASYQEALRGITQSEEEQAREDALRQQQLNREDAQRIEAYNDNINEINAKMAYSDALRQEENARADEQRAENRQWAIEDSERALQNEKDLFDYKNAYTEKQNEETANGYRVDNAINTISQYIGQVGSDARAQEALAQIGVSYRWEDGKLILEGEGLNSLTQDQQNSIRQALIDKYDIEHKPYDSLEAMVQDGIKTEAGNTVDSEWGVKDEINKLFSDKSLAQEGAIYKLTNGKGGSGKDYIFMQYTRDGWRQVSEANAGDNYGEIKKGNVIKEYKSQKPSETSYEQASNAEAETSKAEKPSAYDEAKVNKTAVQADRLGYEDIFKEPKPTKVESEPETKSEEPEGEGFKLPNSKYIDSRVPVGTYSNQASYSFRSMYTDVFGKENSKTFSDAAPTINTLMEREIKNPYPDGTAIYFPELVKEEGGKGVYLAKNGNAWRVVSEEQYKKSNNQLKLKYFIGTLKEA